MTIPLDLEARFLRYYDAEQWRINTIARQLRGHHSTVQRVLAQGGLPRIGVAARALGVDPYAVFITEMLTRFPTLTASRCCRQLKLTRWKVKLRSAPTIRN